MNKVYTILDKQSDISIDKPTYSSMDKQLSSPRFNNNYKDKLNNNHHQRKIYINNNIMSQQHKQKTAFISNKIRTAKYTWYNFIPKNLFEQYHNLANVYFLLLLIVQWIPILTTTDGIPFYLGPIIAILVLTGIHDIIEDYKRHKFDNIENLSKSKIYSFEEKQFKEVCWKDIHVGDIVKIERHERIPCDIALIYCQTVQKVCFIETKSLDGETNLKLKTPVNLNNFSPSEIEHHLQNTVITCNAPDVYIYRFEGNICLSNNIDEETQELPLTYNNFILRGSTLIRGEYCIGIATYTGKETKIMMNSLVTKWKVSLVQTLTSKRVAWLFAFQMLISIICAAYYTVWTDLNYNRLPYMEGGDYTSPAANFFIGLAYWNQLTSFVPISVIANLDIIRVIEQNIIPKLKLYSTKDSLTVYNIKTVENLGQVKHIFSDKTGTLTCNKMIFKGFSCQKKIFEGFELNEKKELNQVNDSLTEAEQFEVNMLFLLLALCHSIIINDDGDFDSSSPDELALITAAKNIGYEFLGHDPDNRDIVRIRIKDQIKECHVLCNFEYTPEKKKSSVIVKFMDEEKIWLMTKGADDALLPLLRNDEDQEFIDITKNHMKIFAKKGLRTLLLCYREISKDEFTEWESRYSEAGLQIHNRDKLKDELQVEIQRNYKLLGATCVEDMLQQDVQGTLNFFYKAGQKVWVITGDKLETTIAISKLCGMVMEEDELDIIDDDNISIQEIQQIILEYVKKSEDVNCSLDRKVLAISGRILVLISDHDKIVQLIKLACKYKSVIICRSSPKQKGEIIKLFKSVNPGTICLAVGDGANDVTMIIDSDVGIGIKGVEGTQATRAADFAISEFKDLKPLMFYHGRELYRRNTLMISFIFYRNIIWSMPTIYFGFTNGMSGQSITYVELAAYFELIFTFFGINYFVLWDREDKPEVFMKDYTKYSIGFKNQIYGNFPFGVWMLNSILEGTWIWIFTFISMNFNSINANGMTSFCDLDSLLTFWWVSFLPNLKIFLISSNINLFLVLITFLGPVIFQFLVYLYSLNPETPVWNIPQVQWNTVDYYLNGIMMIVLSMIFIIACSAYKSLVKSQKSQTYCLIKINNV